MLEKDASIESYIWGLFLLDFGRVTCPPKSDNCHYMSGLGVVVGGLLAIQSVLNSSLGQRIGNLGSVLTFISMVVLIVLIFALPNTANFNNRTYAVREKEPKIGSVLGVAILAVPIYLVPRIGTASTLIAIILRQSLFALVIDHFGLFASPKIEINLVQGLRVSLVVIGNLQQQILL